MAIPAAEAEDIPVPPPPALGLPGLPEDQAVVHSPLAFMSLSQVGSHLHHHRRVTMCHLRFWHQAPCLWILCPMWLHSLKTESSEQFQLWILRWQASSPCW